MERKHQHSEGVNTILLMLYILCHVIDTEKSVKFSNYKVGKCFDNFDIYRYQNCIFQYYMNSAVQNPTNDCVF